MGGGGAGAGGAPPGRPKVCTETPSVFFQSPELDLPIVANEEALYVTLDKAYPDNPALRLPFDGSESERTRAPDTEEEATGRLRLLAVDSRGTLFGTNWDTLFRLPLEPQPVVPLASLIELSSPPPDEALDTFQQIVVAGDDLYARSRYGLWRMPTSGGPLELWFSTIDPLHSIAVDEDQVAFTDGEGLHLLPRSGGSDLLVSPAQGAVAAIPGGGWVALDFDQRLLRLAADGSSITVLFDAGEAHDFTQVVVGGSEVFLVEGQGSSGDAELMAVALSGGEPRHVDTLVGSADSPLAYADACLFYRSADEVRTVRVRE